MNQNCKEDKTKLLIQYPLFFLAKNNVRYYSNITISYNYNKLGQLFPHHHFMISTINVLIPLLIISYSPYMPY